MGIEPLHRLGIEPLHRLGSSSAMPEQKLAISLKEDKGRTDEGFDESTLPPEAQQLLQLAKQEVQTKHSEMDAGVHSGDEEDGGYVRRRGRPRGSKTLNAYIQNDAERRKYFTKRIKALRSQVTEAFARCTGGNILVVAIQSETGKLISFFV